ncbi:cell division protein FtsH, partial [Tritonibacter sp. SIMBA_163]
DDIQKATDLAERAITLYGMSKELGPVAYERIKGQFLDDYMNPRRPVSPKVAELIDNQLQELINGALHVAKGILEYNRELLEETAQ